MKHFLLVLSFLALVAAGAAAQAPRKDRPAARAKPAAAVTLPADAEKISDGVWRARDAQGRTWIYKRTPFGLVRHEEAAAEPPAAAAGLRVREAGPDRVVFERKTPFGLRTWSKGRQELDADERAALQQWEQSARKQQD